MGCSSLLVLVALAQVPVRGDRRSNDAVPDSSLIQLAGSPSRTDRALLDDLLDDSGDESDGVEASTPKAQADLSRTNLTRGEVSDYDLDDVKEGVEAEALQTEADTAARRRRRGRRRRRRRENTLEKNPGICQTRTKYKLGGYWCDSHYKGAAACGCFGFTTSTCGFCGASVQAGGSTCNFVGLPMQMTGCSGLFGLIKNFVMSSVSGWDKYKLCPNGYVVTGDEANCSITPSGYYQKWYSSDCNSIYLFYYIQGSQQHAMFSVQNRQGDTLSFSHDNYLVSSHIQCSAQNV